MRHRVELGIEVPADIAGDVTAKLHYVSSFLTDPQIESSDGSVVTFGLQPAGECDLPRIESNIRKLAVEMCAAYRAVPVRILERSGDGRFSNTSDPHPELVRLGELTEFGRGRYGFGNRLARLIQRLDALCLEYGEGLGASHRQFPTLIGADVMDKCRYLRSFPHSLNLVSHLREDLDRIESFASGANWVDGKLEVPEGTLDSVKVLLSPSICFHCYAGLAQSCVEDSLTVTAVGKCFRYESGNLSGLERLWDFTMREVIFVGRREFVLGGRDAGIRGVVDLLERLGLQFTIETASDPFFIDGFAVQSTFQRLFDLKYEIRTPLPYADKTLAIGSFNYHQDFFGRAFDITTSEEGPAHTACVGFGLERLVLAIVSQHGVDPRGWPEALRET